MKHYFKKLLTLALALRMILTVFNGCGAKESSVTTVKIGIVGDLVEPWNIVNGKLENEGTRIEVVEFSDYVTPNKALVDGEIDLNAFQHYAYLNNEIKENVSVGRTILVAEDVESNFLLLKAIIGKTYTLLHAWNGKEAVEIYEQSHPDLILMDIKMPEMDGLEATRIIRKVSQEIPIIALTAFAFDDDRVKALEAGCNDYLTKPLSAPLLKETIAKYLV